MAGEKDPQKGEGKGGTWKTKSALRTYHKQVSIPPMVAAYSWIVKSMKWGQDQHFKNEREWKRREKTRKK